MHRGSIRNVLFVALSGLAFAHWPLSAQTSPAGTPVFEVASIRQNMNPNPRWRMGFTADGLSATDVTLQWVLRDAYELWNDDLWSGGPAWLNERRFDIEAKYDVSRYPNPTHEQRQAMLQQLLADRFKLVVHHESKQFPLYALVVANGGPKFEETKPEDIHHSGLDGTAVCVITRSKMGSTGLEGCTMADLARNLTAWTRHDLGRTIVDQTGLTGRYTVAVEWTPDNVPTSSIQNYTGPSILTAVKEQLGLELKPIKGPLDTIVIDHVEMPTEN